MHRILMILSTYYLLVFIGTTCSIHAQDIPLSTEHQLENLADSEQAETEDDSYLLQLETFRKNPVNLNTADVSELKELKIVTDLQIENLIAYRNLFGNFVSIYELQAVPNWDVMTIRKLLPFITVDAFISFREDFGRRARDGDHSILLRVSQVLERSKGFDRSTAGTKYLGSGQRIFVRYRYSYKNLLQFGIVGDKDAGEQFLKGAQKLGFDFYSVHVFARKMGIIQALALGDYTVNMGQGLIQWQSLAFKKSGDIMSIKRQSPVLRPYNSAAEFYFHRGAGITVKKGNIEASVFSSIRKINANLRMDSLSQEGFISSFLTSGYNRTAMEISDRNNLRQTAVGGNIKYKNNKLQVGVNGIYYSFSKELQKSNELYNLYSLKGNNWYNVSFDYSYTFKNLHVFGEAAADRNLNAAFINGLLISVDSRVDVSLLYRNIPAAYQAVNGNSFTENAYPTNEKGIYAGITIRPGSAWRLDLYADIYKFPWLKYRVDAPSYGKDFLLQMTYTPNKQVEIYSRYRCETKQGNHTSGPGPTNFLVELPRKNWRTHISYKLNTAILLRHRIEMLWYDKKAELNENGFLSLFDFCYKPPLKAYSCIARLQYFETEGYNSRLYAFENDVLYSFSIPAFFDKGLRYYLTINYDLGKRISLWCKWAQTIYSGKELIGSGLEQIKGNKKSEIKLQGRFVF